MNTTQNRCGASLNPSLCHGAGFQPWCDFYSICRCFAKMSGHEMQLKAEWKLHKKKNQWRNSFGFFLKKINLIKLFLAQNFKCFQAHGDIKRFGGVGFGFLNSHLASFQAGASSISCDTNDIALTLKSSGKAVPWISSYPTADAGQCSSCFTIEHIHHRVRNHINTCPFLHLGRAE